MLVQVDKTFRKDLLKVKDRRIQKRVAVVIRDIQSSATISKVANLKKLKGTSNLYRIRIGDYRIGAELLDRKTLLLIRFLHRRDIYSKWLP